MRTVKAKVIRGVYIRGTAVAPGTIVELSEMDFNDLKHTNYVVAAEAPAERAKQGEQETQTESEGRAKGKRGSLL